MYKLLSLLFLSFSLSFTSCTMDNSNDKTPNIIHSIKMYQFDLPGVTTSGDCSGTSGVVYDENTGKYRIEIDVESTDTTTFEFDLNLPVSTVWETKEMLAGNMYEGSKYICYEDTTRYIVSLVYPVDRDKPGGIFWIVDWNGNSVLLLAKERIE